MTRNCDNCTSGKLFAVVTYDISGGGKMTEFICDTCGAIEKIRS